MNIFNRIDLLSLCKWALAPVALTAVCLPTLLGSGPPSVPQIDRGRPGNQGRPALIQRELSSERKRLAQHSAVLRLAGIRSTEGLGKLEFKPMKPGAIGADGIVAEAGIATPSSLSGSTLPFGNARRRQGGAWDSSPYGGTGQRLNVITPQQLIANQGSQKTAGITIDLNAAYWVAEEIILPDNTIVVLKNPHSRLILIADRITVGQNVTFTYERTPVQPVSRPPYPGDAPGWSTQSEGTGDRGQQGPDGSRGDDSRGSFKNQAGPEFEIWTLDLIGGNPWIDARGQDGSDGGPGGEGGRGGKGQKGKNAVRLKNNGFDGGIGGKGGRGGDGGTGGDGGPGGRVRIFAPQNEVTQIASGGVTFEVSGGAAGRGGAPGSPGLGGEGGDGGDKPSGLTDKRAGQRGTNGAQGDAGNAGANGQPGQAVANAVQLTPIAPTDYAAELLKPLVGQANPTLVRKGDSVTLTGKNFSPGDIVHIMSSSSWVPCQTTYISGGTVALSDGLLTFVIPGCDGGKAPVKIVRANGTESATATPVEVLPSLDASLENLRAKPNDTVTLTGGGFLPGMKVKVAWGTSSAYVELDAQNANALTYVNSTTLKWRVVRPANKSTDNQIRETVKLRVELPTGGQQSNQVTAHYDNYVILVVGDSMAWNVGVPDAQKHYSLLANHVQSTVLASNNPGRMGLSKLNVAHTGAILGWEKPLSAELPPIPGEISTSFPSIKKQLMDFEGDPSPYVDVIIVFGGINDISIGKGGIFDPATTQTWITQMADTYLGTYMTAFLKNAVLKFANAKIVVCGYHRPISPASNPGFLSTAIMSQVWDSFSDEKFNEETWNKAVSNAVHWHQQSVTKLTSSVAAANVGINPPRVLFANPYAVGTASQNHAVDAVAAFTSNQHVWSPDKVHLAKKNGNCNHSADNDTKYAHDSEEDNAQITKRIAEANVHFARVGGDTDDDKKQFAYSDELFHPNHRGAQAYFEAMRAALGL